jgi:Arc/MetJ-type ribon-helix-helix transcriptional regulator
MASTRRKAVVNAEGGDLERVEQLVAEGAYPSVSAFVREAMAEKLARIGDARLREQVSQYCLDGHAAEDDELIAGQAIAAEPRVPYRSKGSRRAKR